MQPKALLLRQDFDSQKVSVTPTEESHTHFEPRHLDGPCFPRHGSRPTRPNGEVQMTVKISSGRMVKY
jgi:hypothetical protein